MEVTEWKRSRKTRSFRRANEDYQDDNLDSKESLGQALDTVIVTGDMCEGLKKEVSGTTHFLNNKVDSVRIHQQMMPGHEKVKDEPGTSDLTDLQSDTNQTNTCPDEPRLSQSIVWNDIQNQTQKSCVSGGYRSPRLVIAANTERFQGEMPHSAVDSNRCMCSCQPTLLAILNELRTLREWMQGQAGPQSTMQVPSSHVSTSRSNFLRNKTVKKRPIHKTKPAPAQPNAKVHNQSISLPQTEKSRSLPTEKVTRDNNLRQSLPNRIQSYISELDSLQNSDLLEPEVRIAEGYDVFIPKSQLVSILLNYSRSGSLLFRKLVSAFFDDRTLASSLPNGKRKRGANDHRKGLDQNIVGAIKVFTGRYCTLYQIDRLPGPKDWIQILQDQIKLARKRLKRGSGLEPFESRGKVGSSFVLNPGL
ncbi:BEN domain-containing protein 7 isoform X2 [Stegostoma tigrinum]|uniref:BEN domain-containing protein 7 isoform X2 n=1 Tax=Stegostoma tigrinum TaxID=3053191 RepID=UPI00286FE2A2|nr:BEN domain-containing protein 7 isoform X2 [Stegostoma tigrinum]